MNVASPRTLALLASALAAALWLVPPAAGAEGRADEDRPKDIIAEPEPEWVPGETEPEPRRARDPKDEKERRRRERDRERERERAAAKERGPAFEHPRLRAEVNLWYVEYHGKVERERDGRGTEVHPQASTFDLDRREPGLDLRAALRVGDAWRLALEYGGAAFAGRSVTDRDFLFDGRTFGRGTRLDTRIDVQLAALEMRLDYLRRERIRLSLPFGVGWYSQRASFRDRRTGLRAADREEAWTPLIGHAMELSFSKTVGMDARFRFFGYVRGDEDDGQAFGVFEFETRLYWDIAPRMRIHAGFRYVKVEHDRERDDDEINSDFQLPAFLLGVAISF